MEETLFEPSFEDENKYKKHIIIYTCFITIIILALSIYGIILLKKGVWKSYFELKEVKYITTALIGDASKENTDKFNIDHVNDIYFNFESKIKDNKIKKIKFNNIKIECTNDVGLYKSTINKNLFSNERTDLEKNRNLEFISSEDTEEMIASFRVKNLGIADMEIKKDFESKPSMRLLKDKIDEKAKEKLKLKINLDIIVELEKGQQFIGSAEIEGKKDIDTNEIICVDKINPDTIKFKRYIK